MHLCRGNCLSQVLPGIFIVSPDTEYSAPLSDVGCGAGGCGDSVLQPGPLSWEGKSRGRRPMRYVWAGVVGGQGLGLLAPADSSMAHFGMGTLGLRDNSWF